MFKYLFYSYKKNKIRVKNINILKNEGETIVFECVSINSERF